MVHILSAWSSTYMSTKAGGDPVTPWLSGIKAILFLALEWGKQSWYQPVRR
jgi:hypothetical protein